MDSVTQALLGAAVGQAGFSHRLGRRAIGYGALAAFLPDLDMVAGFAGPWASLVHHRGVTHSVLVLTLVAPALGWAVWKLSKRGRMRTWTLLVWLCLLTQPLLDWCTVYGTQLLAPVSTRRFALDAVGIIDPVYSLPLLVSLAVGLIARNRLVHRRRAVAVAVLVLTTGYLVVGLGLSHWARTRALRELGHAGFETAAVRAMPSLLSANLLWRVVARNEEGDIRTGYLSAWRPRPIRFRRFDRPSDPLVDRALASERGTLFAWFADGYVSAQVTRSEQGDEVLLGDRRYGMLTEASPGFFRARARFTPQGRLIDVERVRGRGQVRIGEELRATWAAVCTGMPPQTKG